MKHQIRVYSISTDNKAKRYLVKIYSNGTYYINQVINGKVFYKRWTRTDKKYAMGLLLRFDGKSIVSNLKLNYMKA